MSKPLPPPPPAGPGPRLVKHEPAPIVTAGTCWIIAAVIAVLFLGGCERVTEYKCSAEQIEKAKVQFEWCKQGVTLTMESKRVDQCWAEATRAHCEVVREFNRTEIGERE